MKTPVTRGLQILVVDDEPTVSRAIKMLLKHEGHEVQTADSGEAALALVDAGMFDLVITDYSMTGMNGDELATRIKERQPGQAVILATASIYKLDASGRPAASVDFILDKPFTLEQLRKAIARVMH